MSSSWSDWRTDTAERAPLPVVPTDERDLQLTPYGPGSGPHETRAIAPLLVPAEPTGDLPRSARWPLYADEPTSSLGPVVAADPVPAAPVDAGPRGSRGPRSTVPWVAAAVAVLMAAGTGAWLGTRPEARVPFVIDTGGQRAVASDDPGRSDRAPGTSRGDVQERRERQDRQDGRDGTGERPRRVGPEARARRAAEPVTGLAAARAPVTAPPNEDLAGRTVSYAAANLLDGRDETAWRMAGDGSGQVLTLTFDEPMTLTTVGLLNGYAKTGSSGGRTVDWYAGNRRVRQVEWYFDDGSRVVQTLRDVRQVQRTDIRPRTTSTVRLRLTRVSGPGRGPDRRDYTALSEVALDGVPRSSLDRDGR